MTDPWLTIEEYGALIRHTQGRTEPLTTSFGPSGVRLDPGQEWAERLLEKWRGETVEEGAGI